MRNAAKWNGLLLSLAVWACSDELVTDAAVTEDVRGDVDAGVLDSAADSAIDADVATDAAKDSSPDSSLEICDKQVGFTKPLRVCSPSNLCTRPPLGQKPIDIETQVPQCKVTAIGRPFFDDGAPIARKDTDGLMRYYCAFTPPGTSATAQRPLLLWYHGPSGNAGNAYNYTSLRQKAASFDLSGDPSRPGFILVSVQGRNLHWPTEAKSDGAQHDIYHRHLAAPSNNVDVALADAVIDELVAKGSVDPARIYVVGWSTGGLFAQLYGIARHEQGTPGGNHVAAVSVYSAADPFHNTSRQQTPSCQLDPYPTSQVPIMIVSRTCDLTACDVAHESALLKDNVALAPGAVVDSWTKDLAAKVGDPNVVWLKVEGSNAADPGAVAQLCGPPCGWIAAGINHLQWPDGVADKSGKDHEVTMLTYLRDNPLPAGP